MRTPVQWMIWMISYMERNFLQIFNSFRIGFSVKNLAFSSGDQFRKRWFCKLQITKLILGQVAHREEKVTTVEKSRVLKNKQQMNLVLNEKMYPMIYLLQGNISGSRRTSAFRSAGCALYFETRQVHRAEVCQVYAVTDPCWKWKVFIRKICYRCLFRRAYIRCSVSNFHGEWRAKFRSSQAVRIYSLFLPQREWLQIWKQNEG